MRAWKAIALLSAVALPALAHHAFEAEYDQDNLITVTGIVTRFDWINPHAWLYVEAKDSSGKTVKWSFEMGAPSVLIRSGWKKLELKKGDRITLDGYAAKDGSNTASAHIVLLPDRRRLFAGSPNTPGAPLHP